MSKEFIVIIAGGAGKRFWPESRQAKPKHLLSVLGDKTLITQTFERAKAIVPVENILVITSQEQAAGVLEACPELLLENLIQEPMGRDTAAAIGLAAIAVEQRCSDAVFTVLPADHWINDKDKFAKSIQEGLGYAANENVLITYGIKPTRPATGYGYIEQGDSMQGDGLHMVKRFVEKPNFEKACEYLEQGNYLWNAGIFIWNVKAILSAIEQFAPELFSGLQQIKNLGLDQSSDFSSVYSSLPRISIDYAVMEHAQNIAVYEAAFGWDDVGEWGALARHLEADANANVIQGKAVSYNSSNNIIVNTVDGHTTALVGVEDLIVVKTGDATLVCRKDNSDEIKKLVEGLESNEDCLHLL